MKKQLILFFILIAVLFSCSTDKRENKTDRQDKFTWYVQLAGYDYNQADQKGETNFNGFIEEFEKFPWMKQLDNYQKIQSGCSPTMTVKDVKTRKDFWVSMGGNRNDYTYLIGYIYPKKQKVKPIRWLEIYLTKDTELIKNCFKLFFERKYDQFERQVRKLEEFGQMEAQDLIK